MAIFVDSTLIVRIDDQAIQHPVGFYTLVNTFSV